MKKIICFFCWIYLLSFSSLAQNPLQGTTWVRQTEWKKTIYTFTENQFILQYNADESEEADTLKILKVQLNNAEGKLVYEIKGENESAYYVLFFWNFSKDKAKIYKDFNAYESVDEAFQAPATSQKLEEAELFFSPAYNEAYQNRPAMPFEGKKGVIEVLEMVIQQLQDAKKKGIPFSAEDFMNDWVEQKGYHITKSKTAFKKLLNEYENDLEVKSKLDILKNLEKK